MPLYLGKTLISGQSRPVDEVVTQDSLNLVTSGAVKTYVDEIVDDLATEIPIQDQEPTEGNLWIDTSEDGEAITPEEIGAATVEQAQQLAAAAESNANSYTDRKISEIPTPDVSGQIGQHNEDPEAHPEIRNLVDTAQNAATQAATAAQNAQTIANSKVFTAVYGTTTLSEITAAYNSGATVLCTRADNSVKYVLTGLTDTTAYFMGIGSSSNILYRVYVDSTWHAASFTSASQSSVTTAQTTADEAKTAATSKAPMYQYGTTDLTAGSSTLATGTLYFVYE